MASAEALFSRGTTNSTKQNEELVLEETKEESNLESKSQPQNTEQTSSTNHSYVAFTGEDAETIPRKLWEPSGSTVKTLDLSYNKLKTLDGLENFRNLEELVLDNNNLSDSALTFPSLQHLHTLTLNKNEVEDIQRLMVTLEKKCPSLRYLSLLGNRACPNELLQSGHDDEDYQRYRYYVIHHLPQLTFLDSRPITNSERMEAKRVGAFMQVVKPDDDLLDKKEKKGKKLLSSQPSDPVPSGYNPLPVSRSIVGQHRGVYGQCKYVYYGKHSEGNRFIRNQHL